MFFGYFFLFLPQGITIYSTDNPVLNKGWSNATWQQKQDIIANHTYFELGSFYYLANDLQVPIAVRQEFQKYGLCKDEFVENNYVPYQLYVRISNRLIGDYVMTQNNIALPQLKHDSIAVGDWSFDEHMTGRYAVPVGKNQTTGKTIYEVQLEGNFWPSITPNPGNKSDHRQKSNWYDVPYKIMVPKQGQGINLLVPVALSSSAVAFSSTRIENMYMSVGTAAGIAAHQVVDGSVNTVQEVNVTKVQHVLLKQFQQRIHGPPFSNTIHTIEKEKDEQTESKIKTKIKTETILTGTLPPTLPPWPPTYNLSMSTLTMQCNGSGYSNAPRGAAFGIVSYDW